MTERKRRLDGSTDEYRCEGLDVEPGTRAVLRYVIDREVSVANGALVLPPGTVTVAHYWVDRPYNVYHWMHGGATLAYYCNVARDTAIAPDAVSYLDLVIDVLLDVRGNATVLDEDELPEDIEPRHRRTIAQALDALTGQSRRIVAEVERETRRLLA